MVQTLIPALGRQGQVDFPVRGQPGLQSSRTVSATEKPCFQNQKIKSLGEAFSLS